MSAPTPNAALAHTVLYQIDAHPETWDQRHWCGTAKCFAGWTVELSGERVDANGFVGGVHVGERAAQLLGFSSEYAMDLFAEAKYEERGGEFDDDGEPIESCDLFSACNTREDLGRLVDEIFGSRPDGGEGSNRAVTS